MVKPNAKNHRDNGPTRRTIAGKSFVGIWKGGERGVKNFYSGFQLVKHGNRHSAIKFFIARGLWNGGTIGSGAFHLLGGKLFMANIPNVIQTFSHFLVILNIPVYV